MPQDAFADTRQVQTIEPARRVPARARKSRILDAVRDTGFVSVVDIAAELAVSDMTIRRDLVDLEREGLLERTHGGAVSVGESQPHPVDQIEPEFETRLRKNRKTKERIAAAANAMIGDHRTLALDVGTTTYLLANLLSERSDLRVFTSSMRIAGLLSSTMNDVCIAGGQIRGNEMTVCGPMAVNQFEQLWFDVAFIGVSGITNSGLFDYSMDDSEIKRVYFRRASRKIVLCDATKFQRMSLVKIAALQEIDTLITDQNPPDGLAGALRDANVSVHVATEIQTAG